MVINGVININKPAGWTSQDVCAKLRSRLHIKRIGHTGTLDPMATGVLPVCIGNATRIIEYYDNDLKTYEAEMKLGVVTDTLDITGNILCEKNASGVTEEMVRESFARCRGNISQIPPKYSAIWIDGRRAYDIARAGGDVRMKPRSVTVASNEISFMDLDSGIIRFEVTCSKGTYIRTICDDIGRELGPGAVMTSLRRTATGCFRIDEAYELQTLLDMSDEEFSSAVLPVENTLTHLGKIHLNDNRVIAFINGNPSDIGYHILERSEFTDQYGNSIYKVFSREGFLGTARIEGRALIPVKVINHP